MKKAQRSCAISAEQRRDDPRNAQYEMGGGAGDDRGNQHAHGGDNDNRNPDLLHHLKAERGAAVEQDIAGAEQQQNLIERGIGLDVDQAKSLRPDHHSGDEKYRDVGNFCLLREQSGERAHRQDEPSGHQRVFGDFNRSRLLQLLPP